MYPKSGLCLVRVDIIYCVIIIVQLHHDMHGVVVCYSFLHDDCVTRSQILLLVSRAVLAA